MQPSFSYYDVLGIGRGASQEQIRAAYYAAIKQHHPDVAAHPSAHDWTIALIDAYSVLGNADRRRGYDLEYAAFDPPNAASASHSGSDFGTVAAEPPKAQPAASSSNEPSAAEGRAVVEEPPIVDRRPVEELPAVERTPIVSEPHKPAVDEPPAARQSAIGERPPIVARAPVESEASSADGPPGFDRTPIIHEAYADELPIAAAQPRTHAGRPAPATWSRYFNPVVAAAIVTLVLAIVAGMTTVLFFSEGSARRLVATAPRIDAGPVAQQAADEGRIMAPCLDEDGGRPAQNLYEHCVQARVQLHGLMMRAASAAQMEDYKLQDALAEMRQAAGAAALRLSSTRGFVHESVASFADIRKSARTDRVRRLAGIYYNCYALKQCAR